MSPPIKIQTTARPMRNGPASSGATQAAPTPSGPRSTSRTLPNGLPPNQRRLGIHDADKPGRRGKLESLVQGFKKIRKKLGLSSRRPAPTNGVAAQGLETNCGPGRIASLPPAPNPAEDDSNEIQNRRNLRRWGDSEVLVQGLGKIREGRGLSAPRAKKARALTDAMTHLIGELGINQTHVLMARRYIDRLPKELLLKFSDKQLAPGCLLLAVRYGNEAGHTWPTRKWADITSALSKDLLHTQMSILKALEFNLSVGEVGPEMPVSLAETVEPQ